MRDVERALGLGGEMKVLPVEFGLLGKLRERMELVGEIDRLEHKVRKEQHEAGWEKKVKEDLGVGSESEDDDDDGENVKSKRQKRKRGPA
jgi:ATP-dependent RNA helicase DDX24/MAK5